MPNGELVYASNPSVSIYEFTQAELNEHKILFKHIGAAFGRIMLWVSDGQYYASTEVQYRIYSEKATKIWRLLSEIQKSWDIFSGFVVFWELSFRFIIIFLAIANLPKRFFCPNATEIDTIMK